MAERDQNEGSGQQPPIGHQDNQTVGQSGQSQGQNQSAEQAFDQADRQQQDLSQGQQSQSQSEQSGQSGGQSATGQASQGQEQGRSQGDTATLSDQDDNVGPGGYSDTSGGSDLGGGETGLGDQQGQGQSGGFVGSQDQESGEYLQQNGNPDSGFAEQGRGAANEGDAGSQRSDNDDSDVEGGQ